MILSTEKIQPAQISEVLKTSDVSRAMKHLGISYTKAINKRFERVGSLFQGQFQGKPVASDAHLLRLCLYIHTNPVKDGVVAAPEWWEFSNYLEWMNLRPGTLVNREFIAAAFGAPEAYQQQIRAYMQSPDFRSLEDFGSLIVP